MVQKRKASKDAPRVIVVVSDLHAGSSVGLCPPDYETINGNAIRLNKLQRWLWDSWIDATTDWLPSKLNGDPYAFVCNGDTIEGNHHGTDEIWSVEVGDHCGAAKAILAPVTANAQGVFFVRGTHCHTANSEVHLAHDLHATKNPDTGLAAWDRLTLNIAGNRCVFRHHIGTSMRPYLEASQYSITLGVERQESVRAGHPPPQVVVCSHRHKFGLWDDGDGMLVVTPPWQGLSRYGFKVVCAAVTKPGIVLLDWRNREDGDLPDVHRILYTPKAPAGIKI